MHSYLIAGCRTPIGKLLGGLSSLAAPQLGSIAIRETLVRANVEPAQVDEVIMGNVLQAGVGQAPARQAALLAGLPPTVAAVTVNKVCGSGLKAVMLADQAIRAGDAACIVAGGMESMSRAPHLLVGSRTGFKYGHERILDAMLHDGLWCPFENTAMGNSADYIAASRGVSRADQDAFALQSHLRAVGASGEGRFDAEIVPVAIVGPKTTTTVSVDEGPRADTTLERLAGLKPAFAADGTVTAGNASQISDGAAAVVVVSEAFRSEHPTPQAFRILASATSGVPPKEIFIAPVEAVRKCVAKAGLQLPDIDLFELNEAFASQALADVRELGIDLARVNVHGGAIALGHPIGASGARVLVTLMHAMHDRGVRYGVASLCLGGGNAVAMCIERVLP
ncbi:MAG: acetyl-CoA C-acetyltransferase [Planctomycetales bacterium]|nr:acetyl-CoA C-acetyltransferase [Planctomycetales bacterium]MBN8627814.1 acetyl-CoA C-acetyltransferase [Planctomycetota bacterium]